MISYRRTGMLFLSMLLVGVFSLFGINSTTLSGMNFVLISAPGSGKGTFSQYMKEKHAYLQICPGDIFRNEIALGTELGKQIQPIVERGDYVDEDIVCNLMEKYIDEACDQNKNFILDGFPRSVFSFDFLHSLLERKGLVPTSCFVQFISSDEICVNRILDRLVCTNCFMVYNKQSKKPHCDTICDTCGSPLSMRDADTAEIAWKRLTYFHTNIEHLMKRAQDLYITIAIASDCSLDELEIHYEKLAGLE
jgi:adenylate kinase